MTSAEAEWIYPTDGRQAERREKPWRLPEVVTAAQIGEAKRVLPTVTAALQPAPKDLVRRWLMTLGTLCAGASTVDDAKLKIAAYTPLLDAPASAYTRATVAAAGRRFKWLPSFAEVSEFLDAEARDLRTLRDRLSAIAAAQPRAAAVEPIRRYADMTPDEQAEHDRLLDEHFARSGGRPASQGGPQKLAAALPRPKPLYVRERPSCLDGEPDAAEALI